MTAQRRLHTHQLVTAFPVGFTAFRCLNRCAVLDSSSPSGRRRLHPGLRTTTAGRRQRSFIPARALLFCSFISIPADCQEFMGLSGRLRHRGDRGRNRCARAQPERLFLLGIHRHLYRAGLPIARDPVPRCSLRTIVLCSLPALPALSPWAPQIDILRLVF